MGIGFHLPPPTNNGTPVPPNALNQKIFDSKSLFNQGDAQAVITDYRIRCHYERDYHRYMMGIASPGGFQNNTAAFVQLASETLLWVADWTGARFLQKPMVPDPTNVGAGWVLMDVWLDPAEIVLSQDGTSPLYRLTGTYIFGQQNPGQNFYSNVSIPAAPWFINDGIASLRSISAADLDNGTILQPKSAILQGLGTH